MKISKLFHSCVMISDRVNILIDPIDPKVYPGGFSYAGIKPDLILITHEHYDHNYRTPFGDAEEFSNKYGEFEFEGVKVTGYKTYHDRSDGSERGENAILKIEIDGKTVVHMGDIGHDLENELLEELKNPDILFIPVGGTFTVDPQEAKKIADKIAPRILVPMHYQSEPSFGVLEPKDNFLSHFDNYQVAEVLSEEELDSEQGVFVLELSSM